MVDIRPILNDLAAEQADLELMVSSFAAGQWRKETPAPGWTVAHQIAHLAYFDEAAAIAIADPPRFDLIRARAEAEPDFGETVLVPLVATAPRALLEHWRSKSAEFIDVAGAATPGTRVNWFGPPMSLASKITARLMETWAHGQDVADTFGLRRKSTERLRHVALIAVNARKYSYFVHGLPVPDVDVAVSLTAPSGKDTWQFGPADAPNRITGSAEDFCLVFTRRRHLQDTGLRHSGPDAATWLAIGQAFAGDPGAGRAPGQFARAGQASRAAR